MEIAKTDWLRATLCLTAGILAACQIGKAAIAIPALKSDLGLDLVATSIIASAYATLGALGAVLIAALISRFPMQRALVAALSLIAVGNLGGAIAHNIPLLLVSRIVEGLGMICTTISASTLLRSVVSRDDQTVAFSCWSAHIPTGAAIMFWIGPWLLGYGWRTLWFVNGILAVVLALFVAVQNFPSQSQLSGGTDSPLRSLLRVLRSTAPPLLAANFLLYAIYYYSLSAFLPTLLVEQLHLPLATAGGLAAVAVIANAVGNILTGFYVRLGYPIWATMVAVFLVICIVGQIIFSPTAPIWLVAIAAAAGFALTALLPASTFSTIPHLADSVRTLALTLSLIQQSAALGQFLGPVILASWVGYFGWPGVSWLLFIIAICGLFISWRLKATFEHP